MAAAVFHSQAHSEAFSGTTETLSASPASGNSNVVAYAVFFSRGSYTFSAITWNGETMTEIGGSATQGNVTVTSFILKNPTVDGAAHDLSWTTSSARNQAAFIVFVKDVDQTTSDDGNDDLGQSPGTSSSNAVAGETGDLILAFIGQEDDGDPTYVPTGTEVQDVFKSGSSAYIAANFQTYASAASVDADWTWTPSAANISRSLNVNTAAAGGLSIPIAHHHYQQLQR